jgi:glycogen phosphorylase
VTQLIEPFTHDARIAYFSMEIDVVLPLWHRDRHRWIAVMKGAVAKNASYFNSHRMMQRYVTEAYIR